MRAPPGMKWCGGCQQVQPVAAFTPNRTRTDGLQSHCKVCSVANVKFWRSKQRALAA